MKYGLTFFLILLVFGGTSQENSESEKKSKPISRTFGSTRIINSHSTECIQKKTLDFRISHRFGDINGGLVNFILELIIGAGLFPDII